MKTLFFSLSLFGLLFPALGNAQLVVVTGNIMNQKTGNVLAGVNVFETNSGIGTISNLNGFFSLMLKPGNIEIKITFDGFKDFSQSLKLKSDTILSVSLIPVLNLKPKQKEHEIQKTAEKTRDINLR